MTAPSRRAAALRRLATVSAALLLAACTTVPELPPANAGDSLSGRLAIRVEASGEQAARNFTAAFDLRGDARAGVLGLSTPLGSQLAQARWAPADVVLVTPRGTRRFADLDGLSRDVLGESVPIDTWFDWLRGRPWPGAPSTPAAAGGFTQLGWNVDLARFADGRIVATREQPAPVVTMRVQLDPS